MTRPDDATSDPERNAEQEDALRWAHRQVEKENEEAVRPAADPELSDGREGAEDA